ncbi:MAG: hypothetical protein IPK53_10150 [bacterium]|nr:hypothetical protein [bacterium]
MIIQQERIHNIHTHLKHVPYGSKITFAITGLDRFGELLQAIGFPDGFSVGESVLPAGRFGPITRFNAEGKELVHRDKPKETAYRMGVWRWKEWRGRYHTEAMSKIVEIPYKRYPRTFVPPPSVELQIVLSPNQQPIIVGPIIAYSEENAPLMVHTVNLFLEVFGECHVFTQSLEELIVVPIRRLNWKILPPGERTWEQLRSEIKSIIEREPDGNRQVIQHRFTTVNGYKPEFVAIGRAGFQGYVVFGFPKRNLYILECTKINNATYVFGTDWETLSQMTKAEILSDNLQTDRIIHRTSWYRQIKALLNRADGTQKTLPGFKN